MQVQDFANEYATKSDEELLRLGLHPEQLTPEADLALSSELQIRGLNDRERLEALQAEEKGREEAIAKETGELWFFHGVGKKWFGKADCRLDPSTKTKQFNTTIFVVLLWLPLIPIGSYRVEKKRNSLANELTVVERLPLNWEQVLQVWAIAACCLLGLIWAFKLFWPLLLRG